MKTTVLLWIGIALLLVSSCERDRVDTDLLNSILESQHHAALQLEEDNDILYQNAQYLLQDEAKKKYRPVGEFMADFRREIDSIRNEFKKNAKAASAQQDQNKETPSHLVIDFHQSILHDFEKFLLANDAILFLKEEEIKSRCRGVAEAVSFIPETNRGLFRKRLTAIERKVVLQKAILDLNVLEAQLLYSIANLLGGTPICGFSVFEPVVYKNKDTAQKQGNTLIMIEEYPSPRQAENIRLTVNGQNVLVYQGLYIAYPDSLLKAHQNTLKFSDDAYNPLTGEKIDFLLTDPYTLTIE